MFCNFIYTKVTGLTYLKTTLARPVASLIANAPNMEIDPSRMSSKQNEAKNTETLRSVAQQFVDSILGSLDRIPLFAF